MTAIERIRMIRGMTNKIAAECGVGASTVSGWDRIPDRHIRTVARVLEMSPADVRPDLAQIFLVDASCAESGA